MTEELEEKEEKTWASAEEPPTCVPRVPGTPHPPRSKSLRTDSLRGPAGAAAVATLMKPVLKGPSALLG